jgi:hypothetical protein
MGILASSGSAIAFSIGVGIVSFFLIRHARRRLDRLAVPSGTARVTEPAGAKATAGRPPAGTIGSQVELHDTFRDLMGELDSKMRSLQLLIRMADESSTRLDAAIRRAEAACRSSEG